MLDNVANTYTATSGHHLLTDLGIVVRHHIADHGAAAFSTVLNISTRTPGRGS